MAGLIGAALAGAMQGGGEAGVKSGLQYQEELAAEQRAARLAEVQKELQGTQIAATKENLDTTEAGAEKRLNISEAGAGARQGAQIKATEKNQAAQITSNEKIAAAAQNIQRMSVGVAAGHLALDKVRTDMDNDLKIIQLGNALKVQELRSTFEKTDDEKAKADIREQIQLLTEKDNDNAIVVPTGYDEMGKPNQYKIFNKRTMRFVDDAGAGAGGPEIKYDKDGNAYTRGPDGKAVPYKSTAPAPKPQPAITAKAPAKPGLLSRALDATSQKLGDIIDVNTQR